MWIRPPAAVVWEDRGTEYFSIHQVRSPRPNPPPEYALRPSVTAFKTTNTSRFSRTWGKWALRTQPSCQLPRAGATGVTTRTRWKLHGCNWGNNSTYFRLHRRMVLSEVHNSCRVIFRQ